MSELAAIARDLAALAERLAVYATNSEKNVALLERPEPVMASAMLTATDLAALLRVHVRTLRSMRHEGTVPPPIMFGKSPRWRRVDIERWLAEERA